MTVNIRGNATEAIRSHIMERLGAALNQFETSVRKISVQLRDLNGPRGGEDKSVQIQVVLAGTSPIVIEHRGHDLYAVISQVADKVKNTAGRLLARRSNHRSR